MSKCLFLQIMIMKKPLIYAHRVLMMLLETQNTNF